MKEGDFDWWKSNFNERLVSVNDHLVALDDHLKTHTEHLAAHERRIDILKERVDEQLAYAKRIDAMMGKRIAKLVERLDRAFNKIHSLELQLKEKES